MLPGTFKLFEHFRRNFIDELLTWKDTPYGFGEETKGVGVDCSGLPQGAFTNLGYSLAWRRDTETLHDYFWTKFHAPERGPVIKAIFSHDAEETPNWHMGIYADERYIIHATSAGEGGVFIDSFKEFYLRIGESYMQTYFMDRYLDFAAFLTDVF
jgi:cell wall-associated NlpC family hydrolase